MLDLFKNKIIYVILGAIFLSSFLSQVYAMTPSMPTPEEQTSAFRSYKDVDVGDIVVPTVVEVPFDDRYIERLIFAVLDLNDNTFQPYYYKKEVTTNKINYSATTLPYNNAARRMTDDDVNTYAEFEYQENVENKLTIKLTSNSPITSSAISLVLDRYVALPSSIEIKAVVNNREKVVYAKSNIYSQTVYFPSTTAKEWEINLTYGQLLRIAEIRLTQSNLITTSERALRFLAQPGHSYGIYYDPDINVTIPTSEAGNLYLDQDVLVLPYVFAKANTNYVIADKDNDGHPDIRDNCVDVANPDQKDVNKNGRGDVCEDFDKDGVMNDKDNCPNNPNRNQRDIDNDGIGDVCDTEESRLTEKHKWIPWAGIVFALLVIIILFYMTARTKAEEHKEN